MNKLKMFMIAIFAFALVACSQADKEVNVENKKEDAAIESQIEDKETTKESEEETESETENKVSSQGISMDFNTDNFSLDFVLTKDGKLVYPLGGSPVLIDDGVEMMGESIDKFHVAYKKDNNLYLADKHEKPILLKENVGNIKKIHMDEDLIAYVGEDSSLYIASLNKNPESGILENYLGKDYKGVNVASEKKAPEFVKYGNGITDFKFENMDVIFVKDNNLYKGEELIKEGIKEVSPHVPYTSGSFLSKGIDDKVYISERNSQMKYVFVEVGKSDKDVPLRLSTFVEDGKFNFIEKGSSIKETPENELFKVTKYENEAFDDVEKKYTFTLDLDELIMVMSGELVNSFVYKKGDSIESINLSFAKTKDLTEAFSRELKTIQ